MIFLINVPIGLIALGISLWSMDNGRPQPGAYDGVGMVLQATAIASGFWGLNLAQQSGFSDPRSCHVSVGIYQLSGVSWL